MLICLLLCLESTPNLYFFRLKSGWFLRNTISISLSSFPRKRGPLIFYVLLFGPILDLIKPRLELASAACLPPVFLPEFSELCATTIVASCLRKKKWIPRAVSTLLTVPSSMNVYSVPSLHSPKSPFPECLFNFHVPD